jgi:hypothetical protein
MYKTSTCSKAKRVVSLIILNHIIYQKFTQSLASVNNTSPASERREKLGIEELPWPSAVNIGDPIIRDAAARKVLAVIGGNP